MTKRHQQNPDYVIELPYDVAESKTFKLPPTVQIAEIRLYVQLLQLFFQIRYDPNFPAYNFRCLIDHQTYSLLPIYTNSVKPSLNIDIHRLQLLYRSLVSIQQIIHLC
ncbi:hypothetical protein RF11_08573 [Thelohanellus kitauei]|uniref:Uncharacterized protein n=1 Tax=Thelohanellus kitauei TaxID=669202 RepID=A0A0C2MJ60_THEKT|nr:hypothetical protein RF11_08573 [Thelohanellus kitauei]